MDNRTSDDGAALQSQLRLPDGIRVESYLGAGARAQVFAATLDDQRVVVKAYQASAAEKYQRRYGVDIAEFEFQRNTALYAIDAIRAHIARPFAVFSRGGDYSHAMVQQRVDGEQLGRLYRRQGYISDDIIQQGFDIVAAASAAGLYDLDMNTGNVFVVDDDGTARLVLCDFNMVPQHLYPPNPLLALAYRLGIRRKSYRDERNLRKWLGRRRPGSGSWPPADRQP